MIFIFFIHWLLFCLVDLLSEFVIPDETLNHMELVWSKDAGKYVNSKILQILQGY